MGLLRKLQGLAGLRNKISQKILFHGEGKSSLNRRRAEMQFKDAQEFEGKAAAAAGNAAKMQEFREWASMCREHGIKLQSKAERQERFYSRLAGLFGGAKK